VEQLAMGSDQLATVRRLARGRNAPAHAPLVLDRYRLQRRLGAGAFGTVWLARDERLDRDVAVKVVPRERIVDGRLEREARAAARLAHPAIVTLYEAAVDDDDAYLVSELVRGATFGQLLGAGRLSDRDVIEVAIALCDALAHAHAEGVVHRDVKPSNVLIPERPASPAHPAKLTDFGVARVLGGDALTRTGDVVGTAAYMAPEQAEGLPAGEAADLYALALVTYEGLTGRNPVRTGTAAIRARRLGAHLPPLRHRRRDLPHELARALDQALRPRPAERGSIGDLREALSFSLDQVRDSPGILAGRQPRPIRRAGPERVLEAWPILGAWAARVLAAATAASVAAWCWVDLLAPSILAPAAVAVLAGALVLALPRVGWLALSLALAVSATVAHRPGAALVILLAALLPVALLMRKGVAWPLPALAPALGMIGLAGAWPALAALAAPTAWRRAALGIAGWLWLLLAAPLLGAGLYTRPPRATPPGAWTGSLRLTLHDALLPIVHTGALAGAPVWGLAALALPWLATRRSRSLGALLIIVWASATLAGTQAAIAIAHGSGGSAAPETAVIGAIASAAVALLPRLLARPRGHMRPVADAAGSARELP